MKINKDLTSRKQALKVFNLTDYRNRYRAKTGCEFAYKKGSINIKVSPKADRAILIMEKKFKDLSYKLKYYTYQA